MTGNTNLAFISYRYLPCYRTMYTVFSKVEVVTYTFQRSATGTYQKRGLTGAEPEPTHTLIIQAPHPGFRKYQIWPLIGCMDHVKINDLDVDVACDWYTRTSTIRVPPPVFPSIISSPLGYDSATKINQRTKRHVQVR